MSLTPKGYSHPKLWNSSLVRNGNFVVILGIRMRSTWIRLRLKFNKRHPYKRIKRCRHREEEHVKIVWTSVATAHKRMEPQASWKPEEIREDFNQELLGESGALLSLALEFWTPYL